MRRKDFYIWKQRLEASSASDKKSWKLYSYLAVCLISCNQFLCSVVLAWQQRTSVKVIVSKKLMKFLPVSYDLTSKVGALITGDCRKCILTIFFFIVRLLTPHPGKASSYQIKVRLFREQGKAKQPSWISHSPDCSVYSHCLSVLNFLMRG